MATSGKYFTDSVQVDLVLAKQEAPGGSWTWTRKD